VEIKQIKELMGAMGRTGTKRLLLKKEGFELQLERQENGRFLEPLLESNEESILRQENALRRASLSLKEMGAASTAPMVKSTEVQEETASVYVTSPMVGTFYSSPSPDDPPFVKVGDKIEKHTVVCIIEAMKVMNEVKAGVSGTVTEVLVESGHPVEFGTKLFRIT
jgi:acetyl-CoA carboxylase biotin carboxyl carrier protein